MSQKGITTIQYKYFIVNQDDHCELYS